MLFCSVEPGGCSVEEGCMSEILGSISGIKGTTTLWTKTCRRWSCRVSPQSATSLKINLGTRAALYRHLSCLCTPKTEMQLQSLSNFSLLEITGWESQAGICYLDCSFGWVKKKTTWLCFLQSAWYLFLVFITTLTLPLRASHYRQITCKVHRPRCFRYMSLWRE